MAKAGVRHPTRGPGKSDLVRFVANKTGKHIGKVNPREVIKDNAPFGTQHSLPKRGGKRGINR